MPAAGIEKLKLPLKTLDDLTAANALPNELKPHAEQGRNKCVVAADLERLSCLSDASVDYSRYLSRGRSQFS